MMMNVSCDALGYYGVPNPSREELDGILEAISAESKDSGLDERFLLRGQMNTHAEQHDCAHKAEQYQLATPSQGMECLHLRTADIKDTVRNVLV